MPTIGSIAGKPQPTKVRVAVKPAKKSTAGKHGR